MSYQTEIDEMLDILHDCIQHTPLKLSQTDGSDYHKGYIFYQDMVVRSVLENESKAKAVIERAVAAERERVRDSLPIKQNEICDEEDDCPMCKRGLSKKCHTQDISRIVNGIRQDVLQALTPLPDKD